MNKALEILKAQKAEIEKIDIGTVKTKLLQEVVKDLVEINEAISELEEATKPKSCETCKHYDGSHACLEWNSIAYKSELRIYPEDGCLQEYSPKENK